MDIRDRENVKDAGNFAFTYTIITTLVMVILCVLGMWFVASVPFIGSLIDGVLIVCVVIFVIIHLLIAGGINWYFGLERRGRSRLGYGYYAQRIGEGHGRALEQRPDARVGMYFAHTALIACVTLLTSGLLGCMALGGVSLLLNSLMMLLQRLIYTPRRARHLK